MFDDIKEAFGQTTSLQPPVSTTLETGHGRIEKRSYHIITDTDWVCNKKEWKGLKNLIKITAERTGKPSRGNQKNEGSISAVRRIMLIKCYMQQGNIGV